MTQPEGQGTQHRVGGSPLSQAAHGAAPGGKVTGADGWLTPPLGVGISPDVDPTPWAPRWGETLITWITLLQVAPACRRVWAVWADWRSRWNPEDGGGCTNNASGYWQDDSRGLSQTLLAPERGHCGGVGRGGERP